MQQNDTLVELYRQEQLPIFQNRMYDSRQEAIACPKGDVVLVEDRRSGLVYNAEFRPEMMQYDNHYQNEQAVSRLFQQHLESVADIVSRGMGREGLVEVGCGKGYFLELLLAKGFDVTGFDPTYEGSNPRVLRRYFEPGAGMQARGLVLRHVLEHVRSPYEFLLQLQRANGNSGRIYIEVPCLDWILAHRAWFDVFYEHVNYFRLADFLRMFGNVQESGRLFGDQYIYVVADLASLREPVFEPADSVLVPKDFSPARSKLTGGPGAIWGGASKGVIFALMKQRAGDPVSTVIDINPAKQGKYLPATGLLVESPAQALGKLPPGAAIYVMNSNYIDEIRKMSNYAFQYIEVDHV